MLASGYVLNSRYRIEGILGHGGMGAVYLATHIELGRMQAVKELSPDPEGAWSSQDSGTGPRFSAEVIQQFRVEAKLLHDLRHRNLPRVHDFFEADACYYLVMDYVAGPTLQEVLRRESPLDEGRVLRWAAQICSVLDYLHQQDPPVIFRDLKPSNMILADGERIFLIDFGIAKVFDHSESQGGATCTAVRGMVSRGYSAPEQYAGGTDLRSDIYSLGATLYALLTTRVPPESVDVATGVASVPRVDTLRTEISSPTAQSIAEMMRVRRGQRPATVAQAAARLGVTIEPYDPGPPSGPRSTQTRPGGAVASNPASGRAVRASTGKGGLLSGASRGLPRDRPTGLPTYAWSAGVDPVTPGHPLAPGPVRTADRHGSPRRPTMTVFIVLALAAAAVAAWWSGLLGPARRAGAPKSSPSASRASSKVATAQPRISAATAKPRAVAVVSRATPSPLEASSSPAVVMPSPQATPTVAAVPPSPAASTSAVTRPSPSPSVREDRATPAPVRTVAVPRPKPCPVPQQVATPTPVPMRTVDVEPRPPTGPISDLPGGLGGPGSIIQPGSRVWRVQLGTPVKPEHMAHMRAVRLGEGLMYVIEGVSLVVKLTHDSRIGEIHVTSHSRLSGQDFFTSGGTGIGSDENAVRGEFGEPTEKIPRMRLVEWTYPRQGIRFLLVDGRVYVIIVCPAQS